MNDPGQSYVAIAMYDIRLHFALLFAYSIFGGYIARESIMKRSILTKIVGWAPLVVTVVMFLFYICVEASVTVPSTNNPSFDSFLFNLNAMSYIYGFLAFVLFILAVTMLIGIRRKSTLYDIDGIYLLTGIVCLHVLIVLLLYCQLPTRTELVNLFNIAP